MSLSNLLDQYFDVAFAAPDGIKKLRELILSLAMQGKLVPQDEADQPASELLKEIAAEKSRLVKDGKIKASKPLPEIKPDEVLCDSPHGWEWVRLGQITNIVRGGSPRPAGDPRFYDGHIPFLKVGDLTAKNEMYLSKYTYSIKEAGLHKTRMVPPDTLMLTNSGATLGIPKICTFQTTFNDGIAAFIFLNTALYKPFFYYFLSSKTYYFLHEASRGQGQPNLNTEIIGETIIGLPPLAEQRRIVAKIDELMARCDELEKLKTERDRKKITVHKAALNRLLTAKDHSDFQTSWHFITQHFDELYSVKENVAELRKAILQLAVMGKLVPQDPSDRPASELLKEIEKEKQKLIKEGKIKASKLLPEIKPDEVPYDLPNGWEWVRLDEIVSKIGSGSTPRGGKESYLTEGIPFIRSQNIWNDRIQLDDVAFISEETHSKMSATTVMSMDILLNITGASIGRCAIVPDDFKEANVSQHVTIIRCVNPEIRKFIHCLLISPYGQSMIWSRQVGMSREGLSKKVLEQFQISLPPLAEQHRIVAKIDQLMTLCDELEKQIDAAESKQTNLLNSLMVKV
ncbi:restriction endonuclease subunit S [Pseudanabaena mucicola]|uniref:Restriction endonuclease subunit S n=1 Tax=Pseudanabaena mucicola FACHB-723 TaxID=2692860 RepID=A0ABR7ZWX0_9CYAN|nr:restriction endonuclease subunit S [Pseudanabaena mucicola]MBD2188327.1 restriction endonuclease subunit S [Pseudanabaena mucicola FACHB-723]